MCVCVCVCTPISTPISTPTSTCIHIYPSHTREQCVADDGHVLATHCWYLLVSRNVSGRCFVGHWRCHHLYYLLLHQRYISRPGARQQRLGIEWRWLPLVCMCVSESQRTTVRKRKSADFCANTSRRRERLTWSWAVRSNSRVRVCSVVYVCMYTCVSVYMYAPTYRCLHVCLSVRM
jgi:hypothetical protein